MNAENIHSSTPAGEHVRITTGFSRRQIIAALVLAAGVAAASAADNSSTVKIMTQNMNPGTDLLYIVASGGEPWGVDLTRAEVTASDIPGRADLIAARIAEEQPDIVALQEAALWRVGPTIDTTTQVLYDPLPVLLQGLAGRGVPYRVAAVSALTDVALPGSSGEFLRYTDRDVLLIRGGLRRPAFGVSNVHATIFSTALDFGGLPIVQGWISAEVHLGHRHFRLIATHLQSPVDGIPEATDIQVAQAEELLREVRNVTAPVVLCGDFNSDAEFGGFLDTTPTVELVTSAGYADCWKVLRPAEHGYTWPLYSQDLDAKARVHYKKLDPFERIDLFFAKGIEVTAIDRIIARARKAGTARPPFGSDHAGVIATFRL